MAVDPNTGNYRMLTDISDLMPNEVLVQGTEDEIRRLSDGIKALNREQRRKAARKRQKEARRKNR